MSVIWHPAAVEELAEAANFYEAQVPRLGSDFLDEIDRTLPLILDAPERFAIVQDSIRRCILKRFPYGIYYRIAGDVIRILVIRHHSRHPDHGLNRE